MSFFEKVKNMFTEEVEDDDVKVEQIKKEVTKVAIDSPKSIENSQSSIDDEDDFIHEEVESKPIFFDDNDFRDLNLKSSKFEESKDRKLYGGKSKDEEVEEKKIFKPTPIISPVYGVLDKNYRKEDIVSRSDTRVEKAVHESPIDTIRNKAYGTLEDELEDTLFGSNSILFKKDEKEDKIEKEEKEEKIDKFEVDIEEEVKENDIESDDKVIDDNSLTDLTDDISKELDKLLTKYVDEPEEKKETSENDEDLLGFIDSTLYKDGDE